MGLLESWVRSECAETNRQTDQIHHYRALSPNTRNLYRFTDGNKPEYRLWVFLSYDDGLPLAVIPEDALEAGLTLPQKYREAYWKGLLKHHRVEPCGLWLDRKWKAEDKGEPFTEKPDRWTIAAHNCGPTWTWQQIEEGRLRILGVKNEEGEE